MAWTGESLTELATAYWRSAALQAGVSCGLPDALPGSVESVSAALKTDPRATGMLLEAWLALGLIYCDGDRYHLDISARPFLLTSGAASLVHALRLNQGMTRLWEKLPSLVATGEPVIGPRDHLGDDLERTRQFVMGMHSRGLALLPTVANAIDLTGVRTLLDVGSGPGTLGRMLCERYPALRATLVDLSAVTQIAEELSAGHPARTQVKHLAANYLVDPLPAGFDAVVYCGALHQHDDFGVLMEKVVSTVRPGGRLFVVDLMLNEERSGPALAALFALNMALISPVSRVHSAAEVSVALEAAGVDEVATSVLPGGMYTLVSGVRRAHLGRRASASGSETVVNGAVAPA